jgi:hypothetical protein
VNQSEICKTVKRNSNRNKEALGETHFIRIKNTRISKDAGKGSEDCFL